MPCSEIRKWECENECHFLITDRIKLTIEERKRNIMQAFANYHGDLI